MPGYRPEFVTERQAGRWKDCLWASGAMLIDKWTNGETTVGRERLRRLSGDLRGGSTLADLSRAFARLDLDLRRSPGGGDAVTWSALLNRLAAGGGAVLLGDQHHMPRYFGRWDRKFWARTGKGDDHAVYVEGYNPRTGLVWLMDPLAPAGWPGEWVRAATLRRFAWTRGGAVVAAMTPSARPAPFAGVELGDPGASTTAGALRVAWPLGAADGWTFQGADATSVTTRIAAEDVRVGSETIALPSGDDEPVGGRSGVSVESGALVAMVAVPEEPGIYRIATTITDRRFGHAVAKSGRITVYVPGPRAARVTASSPAAIVDLEGGGGPVLAGQPIAMTLEARNTGVLTWVDADPVPAMPANAEMSLATHLTGTWVPVALEEAAAGDALTPVVDPRRGSAVSRRLAVVHGQSSGPGTRRSLGAHHRRLGQRRRRILNVRFRSGHPLLRRRRAVAGGPADSVARPAGTGTSSRPGGRRCARSAQMTTSTRFSSGPSAARRPASRRAGRPVGRGCRRTCHAGSGRPLTRTSRGEKPSPATR